MSEDKTSDAYGRALADRIIETVMAGPDVPDPLLALAQDAAEAPEVMRGWRSPAFTITIDRDPDADTFALNLWNQRGPQVLRLTGEEVRHLVALLTPDFIGVG